MTDEEKVKPRSILTRLNRKQDNYETEFQTWERLVQFVPTLPRPLWMPFFGTGKCAEHMRALGFEVKHEPANFFTCTPPPTSYLCLDNPPFSEKRRILQRLVAMKRPFILILPLETLSTGYTRTLMKEEGVYQFKILIPQRRMRFSGRGSPPFSCIYLCYRCQDLFPQEKQSSQLIYM